MQRWAEEFPDATFLHLTGYKSNGKNFGNFFGAMEDFKYLAGMLAGSRAKADGNPKIGYMATFPIPEELRLGNAIMRGVKQTCPECTMDIRFINTWHDPVKERDGAASLFDAGAQVVFTGADTPAAADVAQEKGKWGVTYDHPVSCHVDACLTAPYWIWGPEYARIAESVKAGTYTAGYEYFDADSKAMGLFGFMDGESPQPGIADLPPADVQMVKDTLAKSDIDMLFIFRTEDARYSVGFRHHLGLAVDDRLQLDGRRALGGDGRRRARSRQGAHALSLWLRATPDVDPVRAARVLSVLAHILGVKERSP